MGFNCEFFGILGADGVSLFFVFVVLMGFNVNFTGLEVKDVYYAGDVLRIIWIYRTFSITDPR